MLQLGTASSPFAQCIQCGCGTVLSPRSTQIYLGLYHRRLRCKHKLHQKCNPTLFHSRLPRVVSLSLKGYELKFKQWIHAQVTSLQAVTEQDLEGRDGDGTFDAAYAIAPTKSAKKLAFRKESAVDPQIVKRLLQTEGDATVATVLAGVQLSVKQITKLLSYLAKEGSPEMALEVFEWQVAQTGYADKDCHLYTRAMSILSKSAPGAKQAVKIYIRMRQQGIQPDLICYNTIINAAGKSRELKIALEAWDELQNRDDIIPDVITYSSLISACGLAGKWKKAVELFEDMDGKGIAPNVVVYTALVNALQQGGQWERAIGIFQQLELAEVELDVVAYNSAIAACAKGLRWEKAWAIFATMRRCGIQPTTVSYNALISACERCGEAERALEVFRHMEHRSRNIVTPNIVTYNTVISACGKAGRYSDAFRLFDAMQQRGIQPDVFTLSALLTACDRVGRWERAAALTAQFSTDWGVQQNTVCANILIDTLGKAGQVDQALRVFDEVKAGPITSPDVVSYSSIIAACERGGRWDKALDLFEEMRAAGIQPNSYVFTSLINACEKGDQWEKAVELFKMMEQMDMEMDFLGMAVRRAVYAWPSFVTILPAPLMRAARATVESGRAARRWISGSRVDADSDEDGS